LRIAQSDREGELLDEAIVEVGAVGKFDVADLGQQRRGAVSFLGGEQG
jgi:hypothetical protein